ncbi:hypothetical protein HanPSC8_Chr10g0406691 [Helianthus annuus]|nr:hypothetical protein HanIR_Chr10g0453681 [Helianthus annuus]KAJ0882183.1 hypothetical protein HanPSC8_Chr10g0406691 [Helianthus annuus]
MKITSPLGTLWNISPPTCSTPSQEHQTTIINLRVLVLYRFGWFEIQTVRFS